MQQRQTLFISDLHLQESTPSITQHFFQFLDQIDDSVDALYILGDLFEAWIGDDDETPFHQTIIQALRMVTDRGIPVYFMHGNRDFLIGKRFLRATGCLLLPEEIKITLYDSSLLLMHGDTLCTEDKAYLKARKLGRNRLIQWLFSWLPLKKRKAFANKMRLKSAQYTHSAPEHIMDVNQAEVERLLQKHQTTLLLHGHTHRRNIHRFSLNHQSAIRIVLGAWHDGPNALRWQADAGWELVEWIATTAI